MTKNQIPEPNEVGKIGEFVRKHLQSIFDYCVAHPEEFQNLQDNAYCLATFRQSYPVLTPRLDFKKPMQSWQAAWTPSFVEAGYWVTSQWVEKLHTAHFVVYLLEKGIEPIGLSEDFIAWAQEVVDDFGSTGSAAGGPRYRSSAIGIAQNAAVRYVLSNIGWEAFGQSEWEAVKKVDFEGACAYCGGRSTVTIDHAVPINKDHLGEHRLGNLAPACGSCNGKKGNKHYRDFLLSKYRDDPAQARERIARVEAHAAKYGYLPIDDVDGLAPLMAEMRAKIKEIADECLARVNDQSKARRAP